MVKSLKKKKVRVVRKAIESDIRKRPIRKLNNRAGMGLAQSLLFDSTQRGSLSSQLEANPKSTIDRLQNEI